MVKLRPQGPKTGAKVGKNVIFMVYQNIYTDVMVKQEIV